MVYFSGLSLLVSMIGLFIMLFVSFAANEDQSLASGFINKESRKIRFRKNDDKKTKSESKKPGSQFTLLLQTIIIGEAVGLFFIIVSKDPLKFTLLKFNAIILLVASFGCSALSLFNAWLKKRMNVSFRTIVQVICLLLGVALMKLSIEDEAAIPTLFYTAPIYLFYGAVVVAIATMLLNVIFGSKEKKIEFDFSNYLILVVVSGLIIGTGLLLTSSLRLR